MSALLYAAKGPMSETESAAPPQRPERRNSRLPWLLTMGLGVAVLAALLVFVATPSGSGPATFGYFKGFSCLPMKYAETALVNPSLLSNPTKSTITITEVHLLQPRNLTVMGGYVVGRGEGSMLGYSPLPVDSEFRVAWANKTPLNGYPLEAGESVNVVAMIKVTPKSSVASHHGMRLSYRVAGDPRSYFVDSEEDLRLKAKCT